MLCLLIQNNGVLEDIQLCPVVTRQSIWSSEICFESHLPSEVICSLQLWQVEHRNVPWRHSSQPEHCLELANRNCIKSSQDLTGELKLLRRTWELGEKVLFTRSFN